MPERLRRRAGSVGALVVGCATLTVTAPLWLPLAVLADLVRGKWRVPVARLLIVAWCWCWIELVGVARTAWLWITGRAGDREAHWALMGWWSGRLMAVLRRVLGIDPVIEGAEALVGGNAIVMMRHASFADSLLSGWVLSNRYPLRPRYVLKKELLGDPCLDIVGNRLPNHFLDRAAADGAAELTALQRLTEGLGPGAVAVIFPEGSRSSAAKRSTVLAKIATTDPGRAGRLSALRHLIPPRPAGTAAMLAGAPQADVVLVWHVGFDGLHSFRGMIDAVSRPMTPVRFVARRVPRAEVPSGDRFADWLDDQWLSLDAEVECALASSDPGST